MKRLIVVAIAAMALTGAACQKQQNTGTTPPPGGTDNANETVTNNESVNTNIPAVTTAQWQKSATGWTASGTPPACPTPLAIQSPVSVRLATSILYPGQTRGGNYKAHGGFRFDGLENSQVTVYAPLSGSVVEASRYIEAGETQYMFDIQTDCGLRFRFDHLLTLTPEFQTIADALPAAQVDDSRTTPVDPSIAVTVGQPIATAVGFAKAKNVSVDFGVYDLRQKNAASANAAYTASHDATYAQHALCWLNLLSSVDAAFVKDLPAADAAAGKTSDYCK